MLISCVERLLHTYNIHSLPQFPLANFSIYHCSTFTVLCSIIIVSYNSPCSRQCRQPTEENRLRARLCLQPFAGGVDRTDLVLCSLIWKGVFNNLLSIILRPVCVSITSALGPFRTLPRLHSRPPPEHCLWFGSTRAVVQSSITIYNYMAGTHMRHVDMQTKLG